MTIAPLNEFIRALAVIQNRYDFPLEWIEYLWRSASYSGKPLWKELAESLEENEGKILRRYIISVLPGGGPHKEITAEELRKTGNLIISPQF